MFILDSSISSFSSALSAFLALGFSTLRSSLKKHSYPQVSWIKS